MKRLIVGAVFILTLVAAIVGLVGVTRLSKKQLSDSQAAQSTNVSANEIASVSEDCIRLKKALECLGKDNKGLLASFKDPRRIESDSSYIKWRWGPKVEVGELLGDTFKLTAYINKQNQRVERIDMTELTNPRTVLNTAFGGDFGCQAYYRNPKPGLDIGKHIFYVVGKTKEEYAVEMTIEGNRDPFTAETQLDLKSSLPVQTFKPTANFDWRDEGTVSEIAVFHPEFSKSLRVGFINEGMTLLSVPPITR